MKARSANEQIIATISSITNSAVIFSSDADSCRMLLSSVYSVTTVSGRKTSSTDISAQNAVVIMTVLAMQMALTGLVVQGDRRENQRERKKRLAARRERGREVASS